MKIDCSRVKGEMKDNEAKKYRYMDAKVRVDKILEISHRDSQM